MVAHSVVEGMENERPPDGWKLVPERGGFDLLMLAVCVYFWFTAPLLYLLLVVVIASHELGHYAVARALKVPVEKFAVGGGPSLVQYRKGEMVYELAALPFFGFVRCPDLDDRPWLHQMLVSLAGCTVNFTLGLAVLGPSMVGAAVVDAVESFWLLATLRDSGLSWESYSLLEKFGLINVALGAVNLLPIPILDGGRLWTRSLRILVKDRYPVAWKRTRTVILAFGALLLIWILFVAPTALLCECRGG